MYKLGTSISEPIFTNATARNIHIHTHSIASVTSVLRTFDGGDAATLLNKKRRAIGVDVGAPLLHCSDDYGVWTTAIMMMMIAA